MLVSMLNLSHVGVPAALHALFGFAAGLLMGGMHASARSAGRSHEELNVKGWMTEDGSVK